jgi:type IX secretion system PorP/SprF family membrane protein
MKFLDFNMDIMKEHILIKIIVVMVLICSGQELFGQQDPHYTQYMYNTMSVNPAYAGSRGVLSATALHRSQAIGIKGSPHTQTFAVHSPFRNEQLGIGLSIVNDVIGPAWQTFVDVNLAYTIHINKQQKLSFGMKGGLNSYAVNFANGNAMDDFDPGLQNTTLFLPVIGSGIYFHSNDYFFGVAVPNFLRTSGFSEIENVQAFETTKRLHYYLIGGYAIPLSHRVDFQPTVYSKIVVGAPLSVDLSANFTLDKMISLGAAYRMGDAISTILGLQANRSVFFGYAFDYHISSLRRDNFGSHEFILRYELPRHSKLLYGRRKKVECPNR